jgi:hypothetical protein
MKGVPESKQDEVVYPADLPEASVLIPQVKFSALLRGLSTSAQLLTFRLRRTYGLRHYDFGETPLNRIRPNRTRDAGTYK